MIPVNRPLIDESDAQAVFDTVKATMISGESPPVSELEDSLSKYFNGLNVAVVNSGTSALDLAIESLNINNQSECVVPTFTIISTVTNLIRKSKNIKLVDASPSTWNMDTEATVNSINSGTRLVIPVHIYGLPADLDPIIEKASKSETFVLEDAAEALGVKYKGKKVGSLGNAAILSFYANKILTGGEGGAVLSQEKNFTDSVKFFRNLCFERDERFTHRELGWNFRMCGLSAALVNNQLKRIDQLIELKIRQGNYYYENLKGHPWFEFQANYTEFSINNYWVFGIVLNRDSPFNASSFQNTLRGHGIETRRFFRPIHMQPLAQEIHFNLTSNMKVSENLWENGLYLPSGLGNTKDEIDHVIETLWKLSKNVS